MEEVQYTATAGAETKINAGEEQIGDTESYWIAFGYTLSWMSSTILSLKDMEGNLPITLEDKKTMVRRAAFLRLPEDPVFPHMSGTAHQNIIIVAVRRVLYYQVQTKSPGPDRKQLQDFETPIEMRRQASNGAGKTVHQTRVSPVPMENCQGSDTMQFK